jgi:hypothetical protein
MFLVRLDFSEVRRFPIEAGGTAQAELRDLVESVEFVRVMIKRLLHCSRGSGKCLRKV